MSDQAEIRVKVKKPSQIYTMAMTAGMLDAIAELEKLPPTVRNTPGMALAISTITAQANALRSDVMKNNLITIARAGHDIGRFKSIMFDANTAELICEFYDADLFEGEE